MTTTRTTNVPGRCDVDAGRPPKPYLRKALDEQMARLAADLATIQGITPEQAMKALRDALNSNPAPLTRRHPDRS